jgi:hypothetical protein
MDERLRRFAPFLDRLVLVARQPACMFDWSAQPAALRERPVGALAARQGWIPFAVFVGERVRVRGIRQRSDFVSSALSSGTEWLALHEATGAVFHVSSDGEPTRMVDAADQLTIEEDSLPLPPSMAAIDPAPGPIARDEAQEALLAEDPTESGFSVYADWLTARGDPRGELALLQARGGGAELLEAHQRYLLGGLTDLLDDDGGQPVLEIGWRLGWIRAARVHTTRRHEDLGVDLEAVLRALLALPSARFLEDLVIGAASCHELGVEESVALALDEGGDHPALRRLVFEHDGDEEMRSWTGAGRLGFVRDRFPRLRELTIDAGSVRLGSGFSHPALEELTIRTCDGLPDRATIASASWPRLERLTLWVGGGWNKKDATAADFAPLLGGERTPRLRHLGIANNELLDELCALLARSPLLSRLRSLDLSLGTMSDAGALALAASGVTGLDTIDVTDNFLTDAGLAALRPMCQELVGEQRTDEPGYSRYAKEWE